MLQHPMRVVELSGKTGFEEGRSSAVLAVCWLSQYFVCEPTSYVPAGKSSLCLQRPLPRAKADSGRLRFVWLSLHDSAVSLLAYAFCFY